MVGLAHPLDARSGTLSDVTQKAGPIVPLRFGVGGLGAGTNRKCFEDGGESVPECAGCGERSKVLGSLDALLSGKKNARNIFRDSHHQVGVGLVVPETNIEFGLKLLDPEILKLQGLALCGDKRPVHRGRRLHHASCSLVQCDRIRKVTLQPAAEALGLADIGHTAAGVEEPIHTGRTRDVTRDRLPIVTSGHRLAQ